VFVVLCVYITGLERKTKTTKVFMLTFYSGNNLTFGKISIGFVLCWTMVLTGMIYTVCNVEKAHTLYIETHLLAYLLTERGKVIGNVHRLRIHNSVYGYTQAYRPI